MPQSNILFRTGAAILLMKNIRAWESFRRNSIASFSFSDGGSFFKHLVQHGRSDLINERNTRFRIVPQYIQRYLLLLRWRLALLRLQLIAGRRLKLLDHLVSRGVHKHTLRSRDTGSDQG